MFAAAKVSVNLAGEDRVLGNVRLSRVFVQWQKEKPCYADQDAYRREVWWQFEEDRRPPEGQQARRYEERSVSFRDCGLDTETYQAPCCAIALGCCCTVVVKERCSVRYLCYICLSNI